MQEELTDHLQRLLIQQAAAVVRVQLEVMLLRVQLAAQAAQV
jgi:hypothetical protein